MTTKPSYTPALRFPDFINDGEWEVKRLGEIITVNSGRDYKHLQSGDIPVYGTGGYMLSVNDKLSDIDAIGIGRKGTIDKPQYLKAPFWTVDTLFFLTTKEGYDLNFVFCLLQTVEWKKYSEQTGVPSLTRSTIEKIEVKIPPFPEQRRIAQALTALDELIAATNEKLEQMKAYKKGLMQQLFVNATGGGKRLIINCLQIQKLRFPAFYEEKEWEEKKLGEVGYTYTGLSGKDKNDFGHGDAEYITYLNVFSNPIIKQEMNLPIEIDNKQHSVQYGDVFFTTSSETPDEVGMSSVWLENKDNVYLNSFCFGYRLTEEFDYRYLSYYFRSDSFRKRMVVLAQGISRYNISKIKAMELPIQYPTIPEQRKIASCLSSMDETISGYTEKAGLLGQFKKGLMQQMFVN